MKSFTQKYQHFITYTAHIAHRDMNIVWLNEHGSLSHSALVVFINKFFCLISIHMFISSHNINRMEFSYSKYSPIFSTYNSCEVICFILN